MTHVEKLRLQAALKALQGNLPRCTAPRHSEPVVSCRRRASGYGVRASELGWRAECQQLLAACCYGCSVWNASSLCKTKQLASLK